MLAPDFLKGGGALSPSHSLIWHVVKTAMLGRSAHDHGRMKMNANKHGRRLKVSRRPADHRAGASEIITTDLDVLRLKIASLNDLWDEGVLDYASDAAQLKMSDAQYAAYLYFRAVSALANFDAEYRPTKATIERNCKLALRLSGLSERELVEMAKRLA